MSKKWIKRASAGWGYAATGEHDKAIRSYQKADRLAAKMAPQHGPGIINPELALLRHKEGEAKGMVTCPTSTEDMVVGIQAEPHVLESLEIGKDFKLTEINGDRLEANMRNYRAKIAAYHVRNIKEVLPHLMVMSTGRCGTMSMLRLLQRSQYVAYHQCLFNAPPSMRFDMMARFLEGYYENSSVDEFWVETRAAEWIGAISQGRPAAFVSHTETIWAPLFAMVHPKARFVYLRRDPVKVYQSFHTKSQWGSIQLGPMYYKIAPFEYRKAAFDLPHSIAWYIKFTETFCRAFGNIFKDRWIEISSDKLFAQNESEIKRLRDFLELDVPLHEVKNHFQHVHNEKAHKVTMTRRQIASSVEAFERIYATM